MLYLSDYTAKKPIPRELDSDENWELIQAWIGSCERAKLQHPHCYKVYTPGLTKLPTRLIDLAAGPEGSDIRLVLTQNVQAKVEYVTLSYCWGITIAEQEALPLLRQATLGPYCEEMSLYNLPKLFQDVIQVTRRLEMRYLWIDALCIIQDDNDDKQTELINMGNIYQGAILNIAAGGTPDINSPLMCKRDTSFVEPIQVHITWNNLSKRQRYRSLKKAFQGTHIVVDGRFVPANTQDCPLGRRAWVMQEQALSTRILHFGKHQLFWHCRSGRACETFPRGMPHSGPFAGYQAAAFGILISDFDRAIAGVDMNRQWWLMVELYSRREITRETDRLPAVSALARLFAERAFPDDTYAAGMWVSQLPGSLCWRVSLGAGAPNQQCSQLRFAKVAPSWSWASVDGHVLPPLPQDWFEPSGTDIHPFPVLANGGVYVKEADSRNPYGESEDCLLRLTHCSLIDSTHIFYLDRVGMGWKNPENHQPVYGAVIDGWFEPVVFFTCQFDIPDVEEAGRERIL